MKRALAIVSLASICSLGWVENLRAQDLVITNARVLDSNGRDIPSGAVVVQDGQIVSVSPGAVPDLAGVTQIDAEGMTVMPGFIDGHRHLGAGPDPDQWLTEEAPRLMRQFLEGGFTTVLEAGSGSETLIELRRRVAEGEVAGPRLILSGRAPTARGGGGGGGGVDPARADRSRPPLRPTEAAVAVPAEDTRQRVRELAEAGLDAIKTSIIVTPDGPEPETLALIAQEGNRAGIPTITHAVTVVDTVAAVRAGGVRTLVHTPHIGQLDEDTARMIAEAGIPMMSTLGIFVPAFGAENELIRAEFGEEDGAARFRDLLPYPMENLSSAGQGPVNARMLWDAGITYGYGTDTRFVPSDALRHELKPLQLVFSAKEIVTILTRNAAIAVGREDQLGTLEPGKLADIVIVDGDPLTDISDVLNVAVVIKSGEVVVDNR